MSESLIDDPNFLLWMLAAVTAKNGGHLHIDTRSPPQGPFNLAHRRNSDSIDLMLLDWGVSGADVHGKVGSA